MPARVMLVEDDESMRLLLSYNLEAAGYLVDGFSRGDEAANRLEVNRPDLLVLDWMLPGLSGVAICRRMRKIWSPERLPILMLSARGDPADREYALRIGANDYVRKPFSLGTLLPKIGGLIEGRLLLPAE